MTEIIALLACLDQCVDKTTIRQLSRIILALLTMTGRVTMLGISRWTEKGGSYRTVQRFFAKTLPWASMSWLFVRCYLLHSDHEYVLAGDETVVTKAGKRTHGLDRFFSSIYGRAVPGLAFFALSLVSVQERRSYPVLVEQRIRTEEEKQEAGSPPGPKQKPKKRSSSKKKPGRPKGSKNKDKSLIEWTPELLLIQAMLQKLLGVLAGVCPVSYLVLDGHFGNNNAMQIVLQSTSLHLISKLRHDAALYFPYDGPQKRFGPRRRYGTKINYQAIPDKYQVAAYREKEIQTHIYQATMLHKHFATPLNVVIIVKTNLASGARAHVVLFSSDPTLAYDRLIDNYQLRFQIEFNFRDAKQFWGLEDFMNIKKTPVTNAVNLSLFMVNLSYYLLRQMRQVDPDVGILDLKTFHRGRRYAIETLNLLPESPSPFISNQIVHIVATLGSIHRRSPLGAAAPKT
jgi:putative transposase